MSFLNPYLMWVKLGFCALLFCAGFYVACYINERNLMQAELAVATRTIVVEREQKAVSVKVAVAAQQKVTQLADVFEARDKEMNHAMPESPEVRYETVAGGLTIVPGRTVCLWNSANQGVLPPTGCVNDAQPSLVALRDLERQHDREARLSLQLEEHVKELQTWICEQARLLNGERAPFPVCLP